MCRHCEEPSRNVVEKCIAGKLIGSGSAKGVALLSGVGSIHQCQRKLKLSFRVGEVEQEQAALPDPVKQMWWSAELNDPPASSRKEDDASGVVW